MIAAKPSREEVARVLRQSAELLLESRHPSLVDAARSVSPEWFKSLDVMYRARVGNEMTALESRPIRALFALFVAEAYERGDL